MILVGFNRTQRVYETMAILNQESLQPSNKVIDQTHPNYAQACDRYIDGKFDNPDLRLIVTTLGRLVIRVELVHLEPEV